LPGFFGIAFFGIAFGNNTYVAVGGTQQIAPPYASLRDVFESPDASSWTKTDGPTPGLMSDIAFGNGTFVAVGDTGVRTMSTGGWKVANGLFLRSIAYGKGLFVAIGGPGILQSSVDGISWTNQVSGTTAPLRRVVFVGDRFLALGDGGTILSSPDGLVWTVVRTGYISAFGGIAYGNGIFVASSGANMLASTNGFAWSVSNVPTNTVFPNQVAYGANKFVVIGASRITTSAVLTSSDGMNWHQPDLPTDHELSTVAFAKDLFVVAGVNGPIITSPDGETWTIRGSDYNSCLGIAYGNDTFVALGWAPGGAAATSIDGLIWKSDNNGPKIEPGGLAFGQGLFVAVDPTQDPAYNSRIRTSTNGVDWKLRLAPQVDRYHVVNYVNGIFVAGGEGVIATSADGITWTRRPATFNKRNSWDTVVGVAFGNETFVALGASGEIHTSPAVSLFLQAGKLWPNGSFEFNVSPGFPEPFSVQASSNLRDWTTITTSPMLGSSLGWLDSTSTNFSIRFYRAIPE